jgi:septum formation protein
MHHQLILASQSPRRFELLKSAGFEFSVDTVKVSESIDKNMNPDTVAGDLAERKAKALVEARKYSKGLGICVLGGDTTVVIGDELLGKPRDKYEALQFLRLLSGAEHSVISGICVYDVDTRQAFTEVARTFVRFKNLSESEIEDYVATGEPFDKAGGYGIQGVGRSLIVDWRGSWSNVVGLPLELLERMILEHGWQFSRRAGSKPQSPH